MIMTMSFAQTYGVIKRYVFHAPDPFAYELSTMFLLFGGVLAVAGVEWLDRNVRNDIISSRFPSSVKIIVINMIFPFPARWRPAIVSAFTLLLAFVMYRHPILSAGGALADNTKSICRTKGTPRGPARSPF